MKEKIKLEVFVDIEYRTKSERKEAIKDAHECVKAMSFGGGFYSVRPTYSRLAKLPKK